MYDVIVVGAGPTGSTAALTLAQQGLRVLILEKCRLPRYKSCSGMLIQKTLELTQRYFGAAVPDRVTCAPAENRGMIFTDDRGRETPFRQTGRNVWRSSFDHFLVQQAVQAGAELRDGVAALQCREETDAVTVTCKAGAALQARYLLDCEGVTGVLRRQVRREKPEYITTYQAFYEGEIALDSHYFYAYLQPELSEYDAWFNVKDHMLVLGVSAKDRAHIGAFYPVFLEYMKRNHALKLAKQVKQERWLMPRISPGCPIDYGTGRILFAGEIAGFLNPMGEGISAGMESGHCAACAIAAHFSTPSLALRDYRQRTDGLKRYMERQWSFVGHMAGTFQQMQL